MWTPTGYQCANSHPKTSLRMGKLRETVNNRHPFLRRLAKHSLIGMPLSVLIAALTGGPIWLLLRSTGLFGTSAPWYSPSNWLAGLVLGYVINRQHFDLAACIVWLPGVLWLAFGIWNQPPGTQWEHAAPVFFPVRQGDCSTNECLSFLMYTCSALNAAAYSVGASIAALVLRSSGADSAWTATNRLG